MTRTNKTKGITIKVTEEQYEKMAAAAVDALAGSVSEWARDTLVDAILQRHGSPKPIEEALMAEFLTLRSIILTLEVKRGIGQQLTPELVRSIAAKADELKYEDAAKKFSERLNGATT